MGESLFERKVLIREQSPRQCLLRVESLNQGVDIGGGGGVASHANTCQIKMLPLVKTTFFKLKFVV